MANSMKVGLVGLGTMGSLVAKTLLEAGYEMVAHDVDLRACQLAAESGAAIADLPQEVARQTAITLLLLPGPAQVEAVVTAEHGLLAGAGPEHVIIDMSTVDPQTTHRMAEQALATGVAYLDAPILGRPGALGNWVLPVGGEAAVVARCRPVLDRLAREVIHVGPLGAGHTLKLLNALMFSAINAMTAEMLAIARQSAIDPAVLYRTIAGSDAATVSGLFRESGVKIVERNFSPTFSIDLLCKDNGLAVQMARDLGATPILASTIQTMNELARNKGLGREDSSALVKVYEALWA